MCSLPYSIEYTELKWALEKGIDCALIAGVQFPYAMLPGVNSQKTGIAIETKK